MFLWELGPQTEKRERNDITFFEEGLEQEKNVTYKNRSVPLTFSLSKFTQKTIIELLCYQFPAHFMLAQVIQNLGVRRVLDTYMFSTKYNMFSTV